MSHHLRSLALITLLAYTLGISAQKDKIFNPVRYAVTSQLVAPDARSAGMGDVGVATDPDVVSQYWNPAKYPFTISRAGVAISYTPWLRQLVNDMNLGYLSGYYRIGNYSAVSGSLRYFSLGEVGFSSSGDGKYDMSIHPYEMSLDRSEEHTSELQSRQYLVCRLLLEKKKKIKNKISISIMY